MKKLTLARRLVAAILAAMTLASTTAAFADTVVYENSFETSNGATTGLYVSMPEIRTYGPNIIATNFAAENIYAKGDGVSNLSVNRATIVGSQEAARGGEGDWSAKVTPNGNDRGSFPYYLFTGSKLEAGIYEVEGWFYTDVDGMNIDFATDRYNESNAVNAYGNFAKYGNERGTGTLKANEWTYIKATYALTSAGTTDFILAFIPQNGWAKADSTNGVLYVDDVKFRKVTNATLTEDEYQSGMPVYSTAAISGQTATARVFAANTTNADKTFQLITAVYEADGRYVSAIVNEPIKVPANSSKAPYTVEFEVPELEEGQYIKSFVWNSLTDISSLSLAKNYSDADYLLRAGVARNAGIPNTGGAVAMQASNYTTAHGVDRIVSGIAKSGVNSFLITSTDTNGMVFMNFPVQQNHTYKLEYYVNMRNYCNSRSDCIVGYIMNNMNRNGQNITPATTSYNGVAAGQSAAILHPTQSPPNSAGNITAGEWIKVEHTFTVDNANPYWCIQFYGMPQRVLSSTYKDHMYIDDFKVTDITPAAE